MTADRLVQFLNERMDEDERMAMAVIKWWGYSVFYEASPEELAHIERWAPVRVLAEIKAKRLIIAQYEDAVRWHQAKHPADPDDIAKLWEEVAAMRMAVTHLAQPYADRPGFDPAWAADRTS